MLIGPDTSPEAALRVQELLACLRKIADRYGVPLASVAIRWTLQQPEVAAVVLGGRDASHIETFLLAYRFRLTGDEMNAIAAVLAKGRPVSGDLTETEQSRLSVGVQ